MLPACLGDGVSGRLPQKDVAGVLGMFGVLGDEAKVLGTGGMKTAKCDIPQTVKIVLTGMLGYLQ